MIENNPIKKLYPHERGQNIIVEVTFLSSTKDIFKCAGVLIKETDECIRVGFNAKDNQLVDFLDIDNKDLINVKEIPNDEIGVLK